jgi:hypothetical protein
MLPERLTERLSGITSFSASGRVGTTLDGVFRVDAKDEPTAAALRDIVRGFITLAKLQAAADPAAQSALQSLELGGNGNQVALSFSIPAAALDSLPQLSPFRR